MAEKKERPGQGAPHEVSAAGEQLDAQSIDVDATRSIVKSTSLALSLAEVAEELRCSTRHVEAMDRDGRLGPRAIKLGRRRVWIRAEVERWLAAQAPDRAAWLGIRGGRP